MITSFNMCISKSEMDKMLCNKIRSFGRFMLVYFFFNSVCFFYLDFLSFQTINCFFFIFFSSFNTMHNMFPLPFWANEAIDAYEM